jgi:hypothetical protein
MNVVKLKILEQNDAFLLSAATRYATEFEERLICLDRPTIRQWIDRLSRLTILEKATQLLR